MNMEYLAIAVLSCLVGSCSVQNTKAIEGEMPFVQGTPTKELLHEMPALINQPTDGSGNPVKITVAVYAFPDETGQRKQVGLSTAVSQGADVWVIQSLMAVGNGDWFSVVERASLDNLVKERQLIRSTRELYDGSVATDSLSPMLFAGLILEGGIVGYDSNIVTGGSGMRILGIGPQTQYQADMITVSLRVVSVTSGEVLTSITTTKTVYSYMDKLGVLRFVEAGTKSIEAEIGMGVNESGNRATNMAIQAAVVEMIRLGQRKGLWDYDPKSVEEIRLAQEAETKAKEEAKILNKLKNTLKSKEKKEAVELEDGSGDKIKTGEG